jgi:hypothetical protein
VKQYALGVGAERDLNDHPVLFLPVGANVILYCARNKCVEIVGVTQGARDIPSFLKGV